MLSNSGPEQRDYRLSTSGNRQNGSAKTFIGDFFLSVQGSIRDEHRVY